MFEHQENSITEITRRSIIDYFSTTNTSFAGRLRDVEFLGRLYDLQQMPSTDIRFADAAGDIQQHADNWGDWAPDWVFSDSRFRLLWAPDDAFLRFLCETIHPAVRSDEGESTELAAVYNDYLKADGWEIFEATRISGRIVYEYRRIGSRVTAHPEPTGWEKVDGQLESTKTRLRTASREEDFQTVGLLSREVLITLAQHIYAPDRYPTLDGTLPSSTDSRRMLEAYFAAELPGTGNEEIRRHAKSALALALALQHSRTADYRMSAICFEATATVVNLVAILSGRHE